MTKFDELQQLHQRLLDRVDEVAEKDAFVREVQDYVTRVRDEAVDVPAPRDRDQLRANLRFWASYLYDATGTYPNTTMRPAQPMAASPLESVAFAAPPAPVPTRTAPPPSSPATMPTVPPVMAQQAPSPAAPSPAAPPRAAGPGWRLWLIAVIVVLALGGMYLWVRLNPQTGPASAPNPGAAIVQPQPTNSGEPLVLTWRVVTAGPSPFSALTWVARIELNATGGNGEYIFWVNGQRLPDVSSNQFTVESQGCQPISQFIGVTSDGRSARQELRVYPPEPNACAN